MKFIALFLSLACLSSVSALSGAGTLFTLCYDTNPGQNITTQITSWNGNSGDVIAMVNGSLPLNGGGMNQFASAINPQSKTLYYGISFGSSSSGYSSQILIYNYDITTLSFIKSCSFAMQTFAVMNQGSDGQSIYVIQGPNNTADSLYLLNTTTCQTTYIMTLPNDVNVKGALDINSGGHLAVVYPPASSVFFLDDVTKNLIQLNYATQTSASFPLPLLNNTFSLLDLGVSLMDQSLLLWTGGDFIKTMGLYQIPITINGGIVSIGTMISLRSTDSSSGYYVEWDSMSSLSNTQSPSIHIKSDTARNTAQNNCNFPDTLAAAMGAILPLSGTSLAQQLPLHVNGAPLCSAGQTLMRASLSDRNMDIASNFVLCPQVASSSSSSSSTGQTSNTQPSTGTGTGSSSSSTTPTPTGSSPVPTSSSSSTGPSQRNAATRPMFGLFTMAMCAIVKFMA